MARRGIAMVLLAAAVTACDPAPAYGPQTSPYVGVTYAEDTLVATGLPQALKLFFSEDFEQYQVTLSLPQGAYSSGTRVTLRVVEVGELALPVGDAVWLEPFLGIPNQRQGPMAVQVLPPTPVPAAPPMLGLLGYDGASYDVLHANACDVAWTAVGTVSALSLDDRKRSVSIDITGPGLWTVGQEVDAGMPAPATPPSDAGCPTLSDGGDQ